jgi:hypothetical protein
MPLPPVRHHATLQELQHPPLLRGPRRSLKGPSEASVSGALHPTTKFLAAGREPRRCLNCLGFGGTALLAPRSVDCRHLRCLTRMHPFQYSGASPGPLQSSMAAPAPGTRLLDGDADGSGRRDWRRNINARGCPTDDLPRTTGQGAHHRTRSPRSQAGRRHSILSPGSSATTSR